ncbi:MAG: GNAT family N-acetyltransferase [Anaerolineales bacterium]
MPSDSIHIDRVKLKDLPALATAAVDGAAPGTFIPITKPRAAAQTHNPYAEPGDIALLLAKEGQRNIGYFGLMPVMLQHAGRLHKVYWLTTWAVAPGYLGKGLGSRLMEAAIALDVDLVIVGSKPARRVSAKYGFDEVKSLDFVQLDLGLAGRYNPISLVLRLLRKALSFFKLRLKFDRIDNAAARFFDLLFSPLARPLFLRQVAAKTGAAASMVRVEQVDQVHPMSSDSTEGTRFHRGVEVVNWMLAYPWVLPSGRSESEDLDYAFTDARPGFAVTGWQVFSSSGERLGFICFQSSRIRGRQVLKVLDYQIVPAAPAGLLLALAAQQGRRLGADLIEGPLELAAPLGGGWLAKLLVRRRQRVCQVHPRGADSPLGRAWPELRQSYVDGDMAFT